MDEILNLVWRYQYYLLPLAAGAVVGVLAVATGAVALRRRRAEAPVEQKKQDYDPFTQGSLTEQRKAYRRNGNPVEVIWCEADKKQYTNNAVVLDRSVGGMRLGVDQEIAVGTRLLVIPGNTSDTIPWTEIEVCSCKPNGDSWEAGCRFIKSPPWSILLLFG